MRPYLTDWGVLLHNGGFWNSCITKQCWQKSSKVSFNQSWALAHFFEVRYPLPTQFFPLDRWRACVHFLNFPFRSPLKRSSLNQWFAERKGVNHSSLSIIKLWAYTAPYGVLQAVLPIFACDTVLFYLTVYTCLYILHNVLHPVYMYNVLLEKYSPFSSNPCGVYCLLLLPQNNVFKKSLVSAQSCSVHAKAPNIPR